MNELKLTADRNGNTRYFSAKLGWREHFDYKEIEILSAGAIPMLIPPTAVQGRKNNVLKFDISTYSTLEFYLTCVLGREQFAELLLRIIDVFQRMQQIYLNYKNLVLDLDKVYIQLNDRTVHFIYLPLTNSTREATQIDFFRLLIAKAVRSTYEQSAFLDECLAWMDRPAPFVPSEFERFIKEHTSVVDPVVADKTPAREQNDVLRQRIEPKPSQFVRPEPKSVAPSFPPPVGVQGSTSQLGESTAGGTVLLCENEPQLPKVRFFIQRLQPEERVELTSFPFLVGTELGSVAYCVSGNAAVSRRHAEFIFEDEECFVVDQKSTNKTYINDCAIPPLIPQQLKDGDVIRLGNEKFRFIREELA